MNEIEFAEIKHFSEGKGATTPWGRAKYSQQLAKGVTFYGTSGHGGLGVSLSWAEKNLTPQARYLGKFFGGKLWYGEAKLCNIVFFEYPNLKQRKDATAPDVEKLKATIEQCLPLYFARAFQEAAAKAGTVPLPKDLEEGGQARTVPLRSSKP